MSEGNANKRIAKNTIFLHFRFLLINVISLFSLIIILQALSVDDYRFYGVIGGIVTMFTITNSTLAAGAIVMKSVPPRSLVAGTPAKVIKENIEWY